MTQTFYESVYIQSNVSKGVKCDTIKIDKRKGVVLNE